MFGGYFLAQKLEISPWLGVFGGALIAFFIVGVIATLMMGAFNPAWVEVGLFGGGFAVFVIYRSLKALRNPPSPPEG